MGRQPGFFDVEDRLKRLSDLGDQLEAFSAAVDFEMFRPTLDASLAYSDGAKGGRPPLDPVLMFKVLVIQAANNLSDERAEYLVNDRLSFMLSRARARRPGSGRAHDLALPRAPDPGGGRREAGHRGPVCPLRCGAPGGRLHRDVGPDRRRDPGRGAASAQHGCREGRDQGRTDPGRVAEQACKAPP